VFALSSPACWRAEAVRGTVVPRAPRADPAAGVVPVGAARVCVAALPAVMGEACPGPRRSGESGPAVSCAVRGAPNSTWRTAAGRVTEWRCRASRPADVDLVRVRSTVAATRRGNPPGHVAKACVHAFAASSPLGCRRCASRRAACSASLPHLRHLGIIGPWSLWC